MGRRRSTVGEWANAGRELLLTGLAPGADRDPVEPPLDDNTLGDRLTALGRST
jgi:hypothetical protein